MRTGILIICTFVMMTSFAVAGEGMKRKPSEIDTKVMCDFLEYSGSWNQSTGPLIRDYLDPLVSPQDWVERANTHLTRLRGIYLKMTASLMMFEDDAFRKQYAHFVQNYKDKLDARHFILPLPLPMVKVKQKLKLL